MLSALSYLKTAALVGALSLSVITFGTQPSCADTYFSFDIDLYNSYYQSSYGSVVGTFDTIDLGPEGGGTEYQIIGITGGTLTYQDGSVSSIAQLLSPGGTSYGSPDNLLYINSTDYPYDVTFNGFSFVTADANLYNIFLDGPNLPSWESNTLDGSDPFGTANFIQIQEISQTPLPSTLPLFAAGLGALGLFGAFRRRRNPPQLPAVG